MITTEPNSLDVLYTISQVLVAHSGEHESLKKILHILGGSCDMVRGTIMLLSVGGDELVVEEVGTSPGPVNREATYKWGEGVTGRVVETGNPIIIPRVSKEPLFRDRIHGRRSMGGEDVSFICVPIKIETDVVGTLAVDVPMSNEEKLKDNQRMLTIVSGMIAHDVNSRRMARLERQSLETENLRLREELGESFRADNIVAVSNMMAEVNVRVQQVCKANTTVMLRGESGTGKELIASAIHYRSDRAAQKMVKVNCAALNENLLDSELFGHERGAFTGATSMRVGRIEEAEGGTLFLDEIGEISQVLQVKLLRFLQEKEFERVGSNRTIKVDVRVIGATNRNLEEAVAAGVFRRDLYYRINVFPIFLPPLRERKEDILPLANHFVQKFSIKLEKPIRRISTQAIAAMMAYDWPGNIRELENCIERAIIVSNHGVIHGYDLPPTLQMPSAGEITTSGKLPLRVESLERELITDALKHTGGRITAAAVELGITARMMRYKIKNFKLDCNRYFSAH